MKALFPDDNGKPMRVHSIAGRLRRYSRVIGDTPFSTHSIRHAFATHLLLGGCPIWAVQGLLGHKMLASTQTYTRMLCLDVKDEHRRTHPRARGCGKSAPH